MKTSPYSLSSLLNDAFRSLRGGTVTTVSIAILLNAVLINSILGSHRATMSSGDLKHASNVNTLLGLSAQFNTSFLVFAALICAMLLSTSLGAIYDSRTSTVRVMRLCGLSMKRVVRHHVREALTFSGKASVVSIIGFLPLAWAYGALLPMVGLAPRGVSLGFHVEALLLSILCATVYLVVLAWIKPRQQYRLAGSDKPTKKHRLLHIPVFVLLAAVGVLLLLPNSPLPHDTRMILMVPWAAVVGLVYGPKLIHLACRIVSSRIRTTGRAPRLGVAIGRLETSMKSRVNPVLPLTIVLAFVVPLSAVMATGRNASVAEIYGGVNAQTVADLRHDGADRTLWNFNSMDDESMYIATSTDVYRQADPYAPTQPLMGMTDVSRLSEFFPEAEVRSGDLSSVTGDVIAVSDKRSAVGDKVQVITGDRTACTFTVGAVVKLPSLIHFDYLVQDIEAVCPSAKFGRLMAYSQRTPDSLGRILDDSQWNIKSKADWVNQGITQTIHNQRSALIVMFVVPLMMALFVTMLAMRSRQTMVRDSSRVLAYLGATKSDFRKIAVAEAGVAGASSLLFLAVVIALNAIVIYPAARAANVNITFDYALDAAFVAIILIIVVATYFRTSIKR